MADDIYQQAKGIFNDLLDLEDSDREIRLNAIEASEPQLAKELRSLLAYHTSQSLVVPAAGPKIKTRSTLATSYEGSRWSWLYGPAKGILFALPAFALGVLLALWAQNTAIHQLRSSVAASLTENVESRLSEFRQWEALHLSQAVSLSQHPEVVSAVKELVASAQGLPAESQELNDALLASDASQKLTTSIQGILGRPVRFSAWDRRMLTLACSMQRDSSTTLGTLNISPSGASMLAPVLKGNPSLFLPLPDRKVFDANLSDPQNPETETTVRVVVPIYQDNAVIAAVMLHDFELTNEFRSMVQGWANRPDSETFFLTERGAMLTPSRYAADFETLEIALDGENHSPLMRDPGVRLLYGERPDTTPSAWPPTLLARQLTARNDGLDANGYRNYVGEEVVGAWRWLPDHELGLGLERDFSTAFSLATFLRNALIGMVSLFTVALCATSIANVYASLRAKKLRTTGEVGPYQIQEVLGEGGMGKVYLAEHALLCRQSAVKVLTKGMADLSAISRFEREVQLASQLTHPNTIAIYDFGRNSDGVFYYSMEYINGAHFGQLVEYRGPIQPGRCIYILRQLCRALVEAHQAGVVHRDIKPQNIMVCNRGGEPDFVKLFDYGLVKAFAPGVSHNSSQTKIVVGTPRFMAPERLSSPWLADPRVDVYSVGAVAYYLLTGMLPPLVTMDDGLDDQQTGVETLDLPLAVVDFGELLSACMAVEPSTRPSNMESLLTELDALSEKYPWSRKDSIEWWGKHEAKLLHLVRNKRKQMDSAGDTLIYGQDGTE